MIVAIIAGQQCYHLGCARQRFGYQVVSLINDTDLPDDNLMLLFTDQRQSYGMCAACWQPVTPAEAYTYLHQHGWTAAELTQ